MYQYYFFLEDDFEVLCFGFDGLGVATVLLKRSVFRVFVALDLLTFLAMTGQR
jgi:hypothetical protein